MEMMELFYHICYTLSFEFCLPPFMDWMESFVTAEIIFLYMPHTHCSLLPPSARSSDQSIVQNHRQMHAPCHLHAHHYLIPLQLDLCIHNNGS